ncbi:hypothetical protein KBD69_02210 [Candidatus Woesebacteria bacterium]|nr:hypothetical protein [Candidatus Woesebacteria bacterium]
MENDSRPVEMPVWMKRLFINISLALLMIACGADTVVSSNNIEYVVTASRNSPNTCAVTVNGGERGSLVSVVYPAEQIPDKPGTETLKFIGTLANQITTSLRTTDDYEAGMLSTGGDLWCPAPVAIIVDQQEIGCSPGDSSASTESMCK